MPPIATLCPSCNERPRRNAGQKCTQCALEVQRQSRGSKRQPKPEPVRFNRKISGKRFLITAAQNATPVDPKFFATLERAAKDMGAELVVIPLRYKNPTSTWTKSQENAEVWAPEVTPYLFDGRKKLGPNLVLVGDVKIQPTATSPLTGFESLTGAESCIIGHTKMQFRSVPSPSGRLAKVLSTTGACTKRNYTDTKAGALGKFHHFLGALVVELDGSRFHLRQVNADRLDGSFIDLETLYTASGPRRAPPALGLVLGDTHARFTCPKVDRATFGAGGIVDALQPRTVVFHDLFDGYSVNHHHGDNPFIQRAKYLSGLGDPRAEVEHAIEFVKRRTVGRQAVIVSSNHDNFLSRWVVSADWKKNPATAEFYLETAKAMLDSTRMTPAGAEYADPFTYWVNRLKGDSNMRALELDESFRLGEVECGMHGDKGPNGSRGSIKNLSRIGTRAIVGHSHTPGIENGTYQTGTSTPLRLEYTHGPSSWQNAHVVTYGNGRRAILLVIDGHWRAPR